jgi:ADP-ribose pyrophosphatase YjhB (NUDIX family)
MTDADIPLLRRLYALARTGQSFTRSEFDCERYREIEVIAAQLLVGGSRPAGRLRAIWPDEPGYVTPKLEVRGAVIQSGRILMVRESLDGLWTLPGGWVDVNEGPSQAIEKEIEQESGLRTRAVKLAALYDRGRHGHGEAPFHAWKAFFLCELRGGEARGSYETDAVGFFDPDQLPPMSLGRCTPRQVLRMRAHWFNREWPTDFD